ncbi:hypothetical protein Tco_1278781 [Tanacetum coccineum]
MNPIATQQATFDNALVPPKKRLKIERCNARIVFSKPQEKKHIKSPWMLSSYLLTIPHFRLLILNQDFIAPPSKEEFVTFIRELGYSGKCNMLSVIHTDQMHQPWRTFAAIINREISSTRKEYMFYPRFTKVIIDHFISKDKTISIRNIINLHTTRDDPLLGTLKFVSKADDTQKYGALIPDEMINQNIKDSKAYKTYYDFDTGKVEPKKARKFNKVASPLRKLPPVKEVKPVKKAKRVKRPAKKSTTTPTTSFVIIDTPGVSVLKKKALAKADRSKGIEILSDVALSEATQLKEATKRSMKDFHISQASGSGDGTDFESGVPDEQQHKTSGTYKGTDDNDDDSQDDESNDDDDDNDSDNKDDESKDDDGNFDAGDNERFDSDDDDENPSFTLKDYDEEEYDKEYEFDDDYENVYEEEDDDLYKDVDVRSLGAKHDKERKGDEEMTDADQNVS